MLLLNPLLLGESHCIGSNREKKKIRREREREGVGIEQAMPSSSGLYGGEGGGEERGGGGKLRKPPARRPPSTPYDRPPSNQSQAASQRPDGGWLSKLVDPACRLIAGGATRIFPSIFSKSSSSAASSAEDHDNEDTEIDEEANYDMQGSSLNFGKSEATGGTNPRKGEAKLNCSSDFDPLGQENMSNLPQGSEFSKIEQMVKAGTFSRDDINRLTEILSSRVADLSNVDSEEKKLNMALKREGKGALLVSENPRASTEEKQGDLDGARVDSLITLPQFAVKEVVGASPVDIARAYMGSRVAEVGTDSKRIGSKAETFLLQSDGYASPLIPALSSKSSVCWPGTMVQDQHDYSTPRSSRYGLHHFQRTPYSRTIYSKSKPELTRSQADKKRLLGILSTPRLQSQTLLFGQGEVRNDGNGSVGPIRRSRSKFHSEAPPRGSGSFHFSQTGPSQVGNSNISLLHGVKKNLEVGSTSTTREFQSVDNMTNIAKVRVPTLQTSNPAARAILEHLDRNTPTPKEKSAELQLATAWKKTSSSNVTAAMPKEGTRLQHLEVFDYHKNTNLADKDSSVKENDRDNSNFEDRRQERSTTEATDVNKHTETSSKLNGSHGSQIKFTNETASFGFTDSREKGTNQLWPLLNQIKGQGTTNMPFNSTGSESLIKIPFQPSGTKPNLASISVDKPHLRQSIFSDSGFSFPVTGSSGVLSEPPTPSIMPFSVASSPAQLKDGLAIPAYTFGTKRSTPALVFSFPSTSTASTQDEVSNIKFSFGSDSKNRISFRSVGNDAICY